MSDILRYIIFPIDYTSPKSSSIIVKNMIGGFRYIDGGDLLELTRFTRFLMAFAYYIATVWGFIAQLVMLMTAGSTTVSGYIRLYVPDGDLEDAYEQYQKEFNN